MQQKLTIALHATKSKFDILEEPIVDEFGEYTEERKVKPTERANKFNEIRSEPKKEKATKALSDRDFKIPNYFEQFKVFVIRDVLSKLANVQYLSITLLEMPVLAFIIAGFLRYNGDGEYVYRDNSNILVYIFISVIVALFIGLSFSAEEIIKDQAIRKRESFLNLSWSGYLNSKIAILFSVSATQIFLYVLVVNTILGIKGMFLPYWLVLFTSAALANVVGLIISASFKKVVTIYILIPFIIIPQIMFSGLLVKYEKLNPWFSSQKEVPIIGDVMASRWLYEALVVHQSVNNDFDKIFFDANVKLTESKYRKNFWIPEMEAALLYLENNIESKEEEEVVRRQKILYNELGNLPPKISEHLSQDLSVLLDKSYQLQDLYKINAFVELIKDYYGCSLRNAVNRKDRLIETLKDSLPEDYSYNDFRNEFQNKQFNEYVNNKTNLTRIVEDDFTLINKFNQTFQIPITSNPHYYAAIKKLNGKYYPTLNYNLFVMWIAAAILGMMLYFNVLPKLLRKE